MSEVTQCPRCATRFKVSAAQLEAHDGLVRCGRCHEVFDATKHLHDNEPSPQLSLPIEPVLQEEVADSGAPLSRLGEPDLTPIADVPGLEEESATLAQKVRIIEELTEEVSDRPANGSGWLGMLTLTLLTLSLLAQSAYYFRVELAAKLPGLKPLLNEYCTLLDCTVDLPRKPDLIAIESSELTADPIQPSVILLNALLHNKAPYALAYPSLELTLTDTMDKTVARRAFGPVDYLKKDADHKTGLPANRDLEVKLRIDTTGLKPSGYRLFLFYPQ